MSRPRLAYYGGLDGLRALAIVAVLVYHGGVAWATGGFLGVEAFFVLSGFLITSLLVSEWRRTGTVALRAFWGRRARRLGRRGRRRGIGPAEVRVGEGGRGARALQA